EKKLDRAESPADRAAREFLAAFQGGRGKARKIDWYPVAVASAEELVDRLPGRLAHEIPEGDVKGADRARKESRAVAALPIGIEHLVPEDVQIERIPPDQNRAMQPLNQNADDLGKD